MQKLTCDGCGVSEPLSKSDKERKIRPIRLIVVNDKRESMNAANNLHEADLCEECRGTMLSQYFDVTGAKLEVPAFIGGPTRREREERLHEVQ